MGFLKLCRVLGILLFCLPKHGAARDDYYSQLKPCPVSCTGAPDPSQWTLYNSVERLTVCKEATIFEVSLSAEVKTVWKTTAVRACTLGNDQIKTSIDRPSREIKSQSQPNSQHELMASSSPSVVNSSSVQVATWGEGEPRSSPSASAAGFIEGIQDWISEKDESTSTFIFGHINGTFVGYYSGARVDAKASNADIFKAVTEATTSQRIVAQHCEASEDVTGAVTIGAIITHDGDFGAVHSALRGWQVSQCVDGADKTHSVTGIPLSFLHTPKVNGTTMLSKRKPPTTCKVIRVEGGDSCGKLAKRCGISPADYSKYNPAKDHCSTLRAGQAVCCTAGKLPDLRPKPKPNGDCFDYKVKGGDDCSALAARFGMEKKDLYSLNKNTWGWSGCDPLGLGIRICLSSGKPPMPAPVDNAVCGPTKKGTKPPKKDQKLEDLNPCPLNACCNVWAQCGTTEEFCTERESETGAPGTSGDHNGCVQNCGMDIVNDDTAPERFRRLGYFEAWNYDRPCLHLDIGEFLFTNLREEYSYTDIHFSFAEISKDFDVVIPKNQQDQWDKFKNWSSTAPAVARKVVAFGGWAFSTEPETYQIFRDVVKPENRKAFAQKVVDFAKDNDLNGLDFDWEYPGAPDIPGIPPPPQDGSEGSNYLAFLKEVRKLLPDDMTLSIAAPASFWYLKGFPIDKMAKVLDYIVFMTYDLHGQWDDQSSHASPGCPNGNCLRSHVNWTETYNALSMVTKAGVPTSKLLLGVATYGRSFKMTTPGCTGPSCTFVGGKVSPAKEGICTETGGYISNAEIKDLIALGRDDKMWYDEKTKSSFLVYDDVQWVAWMDEKNRDERSDWAKSKNFGGTITWAVDLQQFLPGDDGTWEPDPDGEDIQQPCNGHYDTIEDLEKDADWIGTWCATQYLLDILHREVQDALEKYNDIMNDGYDKYFGIYSDYIVSNAGPSLQKYLLDHGKDYFTCKITEEYGCCNSCDDEQVSCNHCKEGPCVVDGYPNGGWREWGNFSEPCPPDFSEAGIGDKELRSIYWTLTEDKKEDFYIDASNEIGAPEEFMPISDVQLVSGYIPEESCGREEAETGEMSPECYRRGYWFDAPDISSDFSTDDVTNPKTIVKEALDKSGSLVIDLAIVSFEIKAGVYEESTQDLIDAIAMPVFMIKEGLGFMETVVEMGKEIEEAEKKALIVNLLSSLFFLIPVLGSSLGSLGLASLGRALVTFGELANAGLGIYGIVDNPKAAPLAIFSMILGAKGILDASAVAKAAKARRGIPPKDIAAFSTTIKARLDSVANINSVGKSVCGRYG